MLTVGAKLLGIIALYPEEGVANRTTFVIDPDNVIQHVTADASSTVTRLKH